MAFRTGPSNLSPRPRRSCLRAVRRGRLVVPPPDGPVVETGPLEDPRVVERRRPVLTSEDVQHRNVGCLVQHRGHALAGELGHPGVADHPEQGVQPDPRPHRGGLQVLGSERLLTGHREVDPQGLVDRQVERRRRERVEEHHLIGEVAQLGDGRVIQRTQARPDEQVGGQLLAGPYNLEALLLTEGEARRLRHPRPALPG